MTLLQRFNERFIVADSGCWLWTSHRFSNGYASICIGKTRLGAHRVSWELHRGKIPAGLYVCHRCDVKACVNPDHLFLGTPADNMRDKSVKGRATRFPGESNPMAKLKRQEVEQIRSLLVQGFTCRSIAEQFGVSPASVSLIATGETWQ